jgi:tetratricopeptide (TPR) repeat protein
MIPKTQNLSLTQAVLLVDEARNAELRRDIDSLKNILETVWTDFETLPSFTEYPPELRAELLRLYGFFLTFYGRAKNLRDYHAKAKDVLTLANKIFTDEKNAAKAAESNVLLAFCYWNAGEVENCEAFLKLCELDFPENLTHPVALQIKINRLMLLCWLGRFSESYVIFKEIESAITVCKDIRLKILFHFEAAILLQRQKKYVEAVLHFNESIRLCRENENFHLLALTLNNLSLLYLEWGFYREAHHFSDKSLKILKEMEQTGWIPHILDSKALILLAEEKYGSALAVVEDALNYFYQGEDYKGLTASLWTRILCLLGLGNTVDAIYAYGELQQIAGTKISAAAAKKFAAQFEKEIYLIRGLALGAEISELEKSLISRALVKANGGISKAAEILKLKNHQALSFIMATRHPKLYEEMGFQKRVRRGLSKSNKNTSPASNNKDVETPGNSEILRIDLEEKKAVFDFNFRATEINTFYVDERAMGVFGISGDAVIVSRKINQIKQEMTVLVLHENQIIVSKTLHDKDFDVFFVLDENGLPIPLDEENTLGEPFGFCLFDEIGEKEIKFKKLGG